MLTIASQKSSLARIVAAFLAVLMFACCFLNCAVIEADAANYKTGKYTVSHKNGVNVRASASTSSAVRGSASKGTSFQVSKVSGNWGYTDSVKTTSGTKKGWVSLSYCKYNGTAATTISASGLKNLSTKQGSGVHLQGKFTSKNSKISTVEVEVRQNTLNGLLINAPALQAKQTKINSYSFNLYDSKLDYALTFGSLSAGTYNITYTVTTANKTTKSFSSTITVNGTSPVPTPAAGNATLATKILTDAGKDIGKTREKMGYTTDWCAYYVSDVLRDNGVKISRQPTGCDIVLAALESNLGTYYSFRNANVKSLKKWGLRNTSGIVETSRDKVVPQPGDIVLFLWSNDADNGYNWSHVGFVESFSDGIVHTIEGNTNTNIHSTGLVARKDRGYNSTIVGILRLK